MASVIRTSPAISTFILNRIRCRIPKLARYSNPLCGHTLSQQCIRYSLFRYESVSPWEPSPVKYASEDDGRGDFLKKTSNIFEPLTSDKTDESEDLITNIKEVTDASDQPKPSTQIQYLKWPMWVLGPLVLLVTGIAPTLWLPISSIFLGPNRASLLSLTGLDFMFNLFASVVITGLDCIFILGASVLLLMADSCASPKSSSGVYTSKAPISYQFWNMFATVTGFIIPLMMIFASEKSLLQPLPFISFAVLLCPYLLLLSIQMLTEMLIWHWKSPVWLVTPVIYEAYRVLQLMRGLKLGAELSAPSWMMDTIRGLVCWWVFILGVQLMRVAWHAGFSARAGQVQKSGLAGAN